MTDHDDTAPSPGGPDGSPDSADDQTTIELSALEPESTIEMPVGEPESTIEMPETSEISEISATSETAIGHAPSARNVQPMPPEMVASTAATATNADGDGRATAADPDTFSLETDGTETSIVESVIDAETVPLVIPIPPEFADPTDSLYPTGPEPTGPELGFSQADRSDELFNDELMIVPAAVPQAVEVAPTPDSVDAPDPARPGVAATDPAAATAMTTAPIAGPSPGADHSGARSMPPRSMPPQSMPAGALARPAPARRSPIPLVVLAIVAALVLGGGVAAWWVSRDPQNDGVESAGTGSAGTGSAGVGTQPIPTSGPTVGSVATSSIPIDTVPTTAGDPPTVAPTAPPVTNPPVTNPPVTNPPVTPNTVPGDLGLEAPMRRPACDGQFVVITANSVTPGQYAQEVADAQRTFVGSAYLRTDETCPSLRAYDDLGNAIYSVYYGPFPTLGRACEIRNQVGGESYVKILDQTTPYTKIWDC